jgi:hypothetical protein
MKSILVGLFSLAALTASAQTPTPIQRLAGKHNLPPVTLSATKLEWEGSLASQIPVESNAPYYDTAIQYTADIDRAQIDANAAYYFEKEFGSKSVVIETKKHNYKGYGMYLFAADKKIGTPGIYKVYYTINIKVRGKKCDVTMSDFKMENQHSQVSFQYLVNTAMQNDAKSITILSLFHRNNKAEIGKALSSMSASQHSDYATASLR